MNKLYKFIFDSAVNQSWHYPLDNSIIDRINRTASQWFFAQNIELMITNLRKNSGKHFEQLGLANLPKTIQQLHVENHNIAILHAAIAHLPKSSTKESLALQTLLLQAQFNAIELSYRCCLMMLMSLQQMTFIGQLLSSNSLIDFDMIFHCFAAQSDAYADAIQACPHDQQQAQIFIGYQLKQPTIAYQITTGMAFNFLHADQMALHLRAHALATNFWQICLSQAQYLISIHAMDPFLLTTQQTRTITARVLHEPLIFIDPTAPYHHRLANYPIAPDTAHFYYQTFADTPTPTALDNYLQQNLPQAPEGYHELSHLLNETDDEQLAGIYVLLQPYLRRATTLAEQVEYKADFSIICRLLNLLTIFYSKPTEHSADSYRDEINIAVKMLQLCQAKVQQSALLMQLMNRSGSSTPEQTRLQTLLQKFELLYAGLQSQPTKPKIAVAQTISQLQPTSTPPTATIHDTVVALNKFGLTAATPAQQQLVQAQSVSLRQFDKLFNYHYLNSATTANPQHSDEKDYHLLQSTRQAVAAFTLARQSNEGTLSQQAAYLIISNNVTRIELCRVMKKMQQRLKQWQLSTTDPEQPRHKTHTRMPLLFVQQFLEIAHLLLQSYAYINELDTSAAELKQQLSTVCSDWNELHNTFKNRGQAIKDAIRHGTFGHTPLPSRELPQRQQLYSDLADCQRQLTQHLNPTPITTAVPC